MNEIPTAEEVNESQSLRKGFNYITVDKSDLTTYNAVYLMQETEHTYLIRSLDSGDKKRFGKDWFFSRYRVLEVRVRILPQ